MHPFFLSGIIGVLLALLNFFSATLYSSKILMASKLTSVALTLGGFIARLGILSFIFYGLSKVKGIHLQTALLSFLIAFTCCLVLKTVMLYRKLRVLNQKPNPM